MTRRIVAALVAVFGLGLLLGLAQEAEAKKKKKKEFLYVHHNRLIGGQVLGFEVDKNGNLTPLAGSPFDVGDEGSNCGGDCQTLSYSSSEKLLFVAGVDGVTVFTVAKTGALTPVAGSPFGGSKVFGVTNVKRGNQTFVYASAEGDEVLGFSLGPGGTLVPLAGSPYAAGDDPIGITSTSRHVITANEDSETLSVFEVGNNGVLTSVGPATAAGGFFVDADPSAGFVYATDGNQVFGFRQHPASGALQALPGSPFAIGIGATAGFALGTQPLGYLVSPVAGDNAQAVVQNANGTLSTLGGPQPLGLTGLNTAVLNGTGKLLAVAGNGNVATFSVNAGSGVLTNVDTEAVSLDPIRTNGAVFAKP
jgi:hypothetical protein